MRHSVYKAGLGLAVLSVTSASSFAEVSYLCAVNEVYDCVAVTGCTRVSPKAANLGGIMLIDVDKKTLSLAPIVGERRVEEIQGITVTDDAILLFGVGRRKADRTWNAVISLKTGNLSGGVATLNSSIAFSGTCSSKP